MPKQNYANFREKSHKGRKLYYLMFEWRKLKYCGTALLVCFWPRLLPSADSGWTQKMNEASFELLHKKSCLAPENYLQRKSEAESLIGKHQQKDAETWKVEVRLNFRFLMNSFMGTLKPFPILPIMIKIKLLPPNRRLISGRRALAPKPDPRWWSPSTSSTEHPLPLLHHLHHPSTTHLLHLHPSSPAASDLPQQLAHPLPPTNPLTSRPTTPTTPCSSSPISPHSTLHPSPNHQNIHIWHSLRQADLATKHSLSLKQIDIYLQMHKWEKQQKKTKIQT